MYSGLHMAPPHEDNPADDASSTNDNQQQKRIKLEQPQPSSIIEICIIQFATAFEGDILVAYGPACAKNPSGQAKAAIAYVDLVDSYGQMTITANVNNKLIDTMLPQLVPGTSVRLTKFTIKKKTQYERGDADYCLQLTPKTTIESIDRVCKQRRLTPDKAISQLIDSGNAYSIGTLGVIVTSHDQTPTQYQLHVKDGELPSDTATVTVSNNHANAYATLERILASTKTPFVLLKNVVRSGARGTSDIKSTVSTFIDELNDECTKGFLQTLASSNIQVTGMLKTENVYLLPYQPLCDLCHNIAPLTRISTNTAPQCITCAKNTTFTYQPFLQCKIDTAHGIVDCNLHTKLLQQNLPELAKIPFENYKKNMSTVVYLLSKFQIQGTFTVAMNNSVVAIEKEGTNV